MFRLHKLSPRDAAVLILINDHGDYKDDDDDNNLTYDCYRTNQ